METTATLEAAPVLAKALSEEMQKALTLLLEAHEYARDLGEKDWEFAVELPAFLAAGCSRSALRWLVAKGYAVHAVEKSQAKAAQRFFHRPANLSFAAATCFVLTPSGLAVAQPQGHGQGQGLQVPGLSLADQEGPGHLLPRWDAELRELRLGNWMIKAFSQPAPNQETILSTFQDDGWPFHIDNPLSPTLDWDGRLRLHDAIGRLNRHQQRRLLHFRSVNNGDGIRWEMIRESPPERR